MKLPPIPKSITKVQEKLRASGESSQTYFKTQWIVVGHSGYSYSSEGSLKYVCQSEAETIPWLEDKDDE